MGAGMGLSQGVGASRFRAFAGVGWSFRKPEVSVTLQFDVDPDADRDGDQFPDITDACPDQAETVDGFEDDDGCPELDGDGDGVAWGKDLCPEEPIHPEQDPRYSDGCPKVAEFAGDKIVITEAIFFREGRAELVGGSEGVLQAVADVMVAHPEINFFLVEGHTNSNGSDVYNLRLSDARAYVVIQWLSQHGVEPTRLLSKGFGESRPLVAADDPDALAINRRVEFRVIRVEDLPADARRVELPANMRE
jgi:outer membrane protein OmpA-like peptidoglycan-associated protein